MIVTTSEVMRETEVAAVNSGVTMETLMKNAGTAVAELAAGIIAQKKLKNVCILCGSGNNGGDGFVVARLLSMMCRVSVILTSGEPKTTLSKMNFELLPENVDVLYLSSRYYECIGIVRESDMIIDAVYGIGFHGALGAELADLIAFCNDNMKAVRIAVDLPSGIECDTGISEGGCFIADHTVTFTALKPLHVLYPSSDLCGKIKVVSVGIPERVLKNAPAMMTSTEKYVREHPFPKLSPSAHKGSRGTLLTVCGSFGMAGAAVLSAGAALRCGVGLVKAAMPESVYPIAASQLSEPVFIPLSQSKDGQIDIDEYGRLMEEMNEKSSASLIGCGLGQSQNLSSLVALLIDGAKKPIALDADGINAMTANINVLKRSGAPMVITPHPGEMARLLGVDVSVVQKDRYHIALRFAREFGVTVVLKGANTIIATPSEKVYVNLTGNNGMGKGGSGDVLAGMIASFLAQGMSTEAAAVTAVYYHGLAGDRCAEKYSERSMQPGDMVSELKTIF